MRGAVDSASESRDDQNALLPEVVREPAGEAACRRRGVPRTDDRNRLPLKQVEVALGSQQRRCIVQLGKQPRKKPLPKCEVACPEPFDGLDLALGIRSGGQPRRCASSASGQVRHGFECRASAAEPREELTIRHRANPGRAHQPQAVGEVFDPRRGSVPFISRRMFSRWSLLAMNASSRLSSEPPTPTFSPPIDQV
jgi:hypothetical protein